MSAIAFWLIYLALLFVLVSLVKPFHKLSAWVWFVGLGLALLMMYEWPAGGVVLVFHHPVQMERSLKLGRLLLQEDSVTRTGLHLLFTGMLIGSISALILPEWSPHLPWLALSLLSALVSISIQSPWAWGWGTGVWAAGSLVAAYGGWPNPGRSAWQWLLLPFIFAIALFALLVFEESLPSTHGTWRLYLIALFLLGISNLAPLHIGGVNLVEEGHPMGAVWALWSHTVVFLISLQRVEISPAYQNALWQITPFLKLLASITLLWAGIGGMSHRHLGRLMGYAAAYNWAITLLLWLAYPNNPDVIQWTLAVRLVGLTGAAIGLLTLLQYEQETSLVAFTGWARRRTWGSVLWAIGVATLAGLPFTAGGWLLWTTPHTNSEGFYFWLILMGSMGLLIGLGRALVTLWGPLKNPLLPREEGMRRWILWSLNILMVLLGIMPQMVARLGKWLVG